MNARSVYDGSLQMFVQQPREVDVRRLRFLRWLVEHGQLEHRVAGPPSGHYAATIDATPDERRVFLAC